MGPKRSSSTSKSPKGRSKSPVRGSTLAEQQQRAKEYAAKNFGSKEKSPPVGSKRKADSPGASKSPVAKPSTTSAKSTKKSSTRSKSPPPARSALKRQKKGDTGTPVMSEESSDEEEQTPVARGRSRSRTASTSKAAVLEKKASPKAPSPSVTAAQKKAQEYAAKNFGGNATAAAATAAAEVKSPVNNRIGKAPASSRPRSVSPYGGVAGGGSSSGSSAIPMPSLRQRSDRRSGTGPFAGSAVKVPVNKAVPAVPRDEGSEDERDSVPARGRGLPRSPQGSPSDNGVIVQGVSGNTSSPRLPYNPDLDPWYVAHIDGIAVVVISSMLFYCFVDIGAARDALVAAATPRSYSVEELRAMAELKKSQAMYMLAITVFFPVVYGLSIGGYFNYGMGLLFGSPEEKKEEAPAPAPTPAPVTASGRPARSISPVRNASKYDMHGRVIGARPTVAAAAAAAAAADKANKNSSKGFLASSLSDPVVAGVLTTALLSVVTVALYPSKYAMYTGLVAFALATGVVLYTMNDIHSKKQNRIDGLTRLAKDLLRNSHRGGPFPVSYILEEILEMSQDSKWPASCPDVVKKMSLSQIKQTWQPDVISSVLTDSRVQQATMDYQGAPKLACWKFAGADSSSPVPSFSFGQGVGGRSGARANSPFVNRANTGTR